jgi:hypothetical protein
MSIKTLLYPLTNTQTSSIEQKRAMLRKAMLKHPLDARFEHALMATFTPALIQRAAKHGVFVSYHRNDEVFALELDTELRKVGINVWMDTIDVPEGADWRTEVITALRQCGILLMVLSPDALTDADLLNEQQYFLDTGKILVPVLHQTCDLTKIDVSVPPIDFRHQTERSLTRLIRLLIGHD